MCNAVEAGDVVKASDAVQAGDTMEAGDVVEAGDAVGFFTWPFSLVSDRHNRSSS